MYYSIQTIGQKTEITETGPRGGGRVVKVPRYSCIKEITSISLSVEVGFRAFEKRFNTEITHLYEI